MKTTTIKRVLASIAAMTICAAMAVPAMTASAAGEGTIIINNAARQDVTESLTVYKLFDLEINGSAYKYTVVDKWKDYVTLLTCTPYGINTHRLLVRGVRIPYEEAEKAGLFVEIDAVYLDKTLLIPFAVIPADLVCIIWILSKNGKKQNKKKTAI